MELVKVLEIGKATVVITMQYNYDVIDLDGHVSISKQIVKLIDAQLFNNETDEFIQKSSDGFIYLTDGKARFGNILITESTGTLILEAIKEMHLELSKKFGIKTLEEEYKEEDLERATKIMAEIKVRKTEILSDREENAWAVNYNNVNNEGENGFVPTRVTLEDLEFAKLTLGGC